jgi:hypothetical protein
LNGGDQRARRPWYAGREDRITAAILIPIIAAIALLLLLSYLGSLSSQPPPVRSIIWVQLESSVRTVFVLNLQSPTGLQLDQTFHMFGNVSNRGPINATLENLTISPPFVLNAIETVLPASVPVQSTIAFQMLVQAPSTPGFYNVTVFVWLG